jgi:ribosomal protein S17E
MLEELFNLVKENAQEIVVNNVNVPNEHNDAVMAEATNTVASSLRNMVAGGGLQNIMSLFGGGNGQQQSASSLMSNPIVNMMVGQFVSKLTNKFNMNGSQANQVANNLIPSVMSQLVNNTNDPNNSTFSLDGLLNSLTGGQVTQQQTAGGFNLQDLVSQFTGGGQSGNAGGLMDIVSKFAEGAQGQQQRNGGGGLMDMIQGFLKK